MFGLDPEIAYHLERQKKQDFLRDEVLMKGFNQVEFAQYIDTKKGKWTLCFACDGRSIPLCDSS